MKVISVGQFLVSLLVMGVASSFPFPICRLRRTKISAFRTHLIMAFHFVNTRSHVL